MLTGDFNAQSTDWGYEDIDERGRYLTDFMLLKSLFIQNSPNVDLSFLVRRGNNLLTGWPDQTIATIAR